MKKFTLKIISETTSETIIVEVDAMRKLFTEPKLYIPKVGGKPTIIPNKRWFVYFYFRNPNTNKLERFKHSHEINRLETVAERKEAGLNWVEAWRILLHKGYNPFESQGLVEKTFQQNKIYSIREAFKYAYDNKVGTWKKATADDYFTRLQLFVNWCHTNNIDDLDIRKLEDIHVIKFFNWLVSPNGRNLGATSQDNYKRCLSSLMTKLVQDKIIKENIISTVATKKNKPIKNTPFTGFQAKEIKDYLLKNDKQLYHYIQFIIYTFLRPREIIRLQVQDINFKEKYLKVETKTERRAIKKLIGPILSFLDGIDIDSLPSKANLFTNTGEPYIWDAEEKTKVDHFAHRFKAVKKHFKFGAEYGLYSFRHTAALDLYHSFVKQGKTEREAILQLMPITGHASEDALRNYLRDVGGMLPKDYGYLYTIEF